MKASTRPAASMCEGPLLKKLILYTIPIILSGVVQLLFNAVDLIVVGQFGSDVSLAAVGATGSLTTLIVNLFIGMSVGTGVSVAHGLGEGNDDFVKKVIHTSVPLALIGGVVLGVVGVVGAPYFLSLMGTPDNVIGLATQYMQIYFAGIIFSLLYNFSAAILRAAGDTGTPLIFLCISGCVNVALNLVFVIVFHMDVAGVALATVISHAISAVLTTVALMRRTDQCRFEIKKMCIDKAALGEIIRIGLPSGIQGSFFSISNVLIQSSINSFGDVVMSGNAAASNIEGFIYTSMNAFLQTSQNFVAQNHGAKKFDRIKKTIILDLIMVAVFGFALGQLAFHFGAPLLSIYTSSQDAIAAGLTRLSRIAVLYFLCGMMDSLVGSIRGLGCSIPTMIISLLGACGFRILWIFTIFQIPEFHTPLWLYNSYAISWVITIIAEVVALIIVYNNAKRRAAESKAAEDSQA